MSNMDHKTPQKTVGELRYSQRANSYKTPGEILIYTV